jgi:hypothetical protein
MCKLLLMATKCQASTKTIKSTWFCEFEASIHDRTEQV